MGIWQGIILLILDFILSILLIFVGGYLFSAILNKIWGNKEQILIVPPFFTFRFASVFVFQSIIMILMLGYQIRYNEYEINVINDDSILHILMVVLLIGIIVTLCTYTQLCKNRIYRRSIIHLFKPKLYSYEDVIEIKVNTFKNSRGIIFLRYYLIFNDNYKINLNTMEIHKGGFGNNIGFNSIIKIEKNIPAKIPHYITDEAINELLKHNIHIKDFPNKFRRS